MAPSSVEKILEAFNDFKVEVMTELARMQANAQRDKEENLARRVRQLELVVLALVIIVGAKALGVELPVING